MPLQACKNDNLFHCILSFLCVYNAIMPLQACKNDNLFPQSLVVTKEHIWLLSYSYYFHVTAYCM